MSYKIIHVHLNPEPKDDAPISLFKKFGEPEIKPHPMPKTLPDEMRGSYDENGNFYTGD